MYIKFLGGVLLSYGSSYSFAIKDLFFPRFCLHRRARVYTLARIWLKVYFRTDIIGSYSGLYNSRATSVARSPYKKRKQDSGSGQPPPHLVHAPTTLLIKYPHATRRERKKSVLAGPAKRKRASQQVVQKKKVKKNLIGNRTHGYI